MPNRGPLEIRQHEGVTVITLGADHRHIDEQVLQSLHLGEAIIGAAVEADPPRVVLDLSRTEFFGSSFIEVLFRAWNRVRGREGGRFAISGLTPYCAEVVQVTHLDRLWEIYPTRNDALETLRTN